MAKRWYSVVVPPAEAARLRALDNRDQGKASWPLGPNRSFRRRSRTRFEVKDYASMGPGKAMVTTLGRAVLHDDDQVDVVIRTTGAWAGWLLVAGGVLMLAVVPRDGLVALAFAAVFVAAGWGLFLHRPHADADLDAVEQVMRAEIGGEWRSGPAERRPPGVSGR
ncbi:hypothetical protein ABFT23_01575 [Nocardioides sp. C4-1]|uniref:hypothetical protein n=1 Tax=Nocardioides sp. C4-1 TaxID=3151851 RepID=UPI003263D1C1